MRLTGGGEMQDPLTTAGTGTVVVGIDGSEPSLRALRWAADEALAHGWDLEVVHVWERPQSYAPLGVGSYPIDPGPAHDEGRKVLDRALAEVRARAPGVALLGRLEEGAPGTVMVDAAHDADLVVVGTRGLGGIKSFFLGSVSQQVAHHARCPVVIVPPDDEAEEHAAAG
jgi:nucleotide-binding universal stress UspA family protein